MTWQDRMQELTIAKTYAKTEHIFPQKQHSNLESPKSIAKRAIFAAKLY